MSNAYEEAFGVRSLTGLIQAFRTTDRERFFTKWFEKGKRDVVEGNTFEYDPQKMSRELAPVVGAESPAPSTPRTELIRVKLGMVDVKQFTFIPASRLFRERGYGELVSNAKAVIAGELENLRGKIDKTKEYMAVNTLLGSLTISPATIPGSTYTDTITPPAAAPINAYNRVNAWTNVATTIASTEVPTLVDTY